MALGGSSHPHLQQLCQHHSQSPTDLIRRNPSCPLKQVSVRSRGKLRFPRRPQEQHHGSAWCCPLYQQRCACSCPRMLVTCGIHSKRFRFTCLTPPCALAGTSSKACFSSRLPSCQAPWETGTLVCALGTQFEAWVLLHSFSRKVPRCTTKASDNGGALLQGTCNSACEGEADSCLGWNS